MRTARTLLGLAGLAAMGYAAYGAVSDDGVNLPAVLTFLVAVVIGHDLIVLPLAIAIGFLVVRYVATWARAWVQAGLFCSAVVSVLSVPLLVGAGRAADNPTKLPLDYGRGLLMVLVLIWVTVAAGALIARRRAPAGAPDRPASR